MTNATFLNAMNLCLNNLDSFRDQYYEITDDWTNFMTVDDQKDIMNAMRTIESTLQRCKDRVYETDRSRWR